MVFGRNYDWLADAGMVCTNLRGLVKISSPTKDGKSISWVSRHGSITFNQYGKEFPTGGMNEKGLVVELMWLDGTSYPKKDDRPSIGVLQWIQYQLDNSSTIDDVIASDNILRITQTGTPLHYLVADSTGKAATIEFLDGKMVVHTGKDLPLPVLTNDRYTNSLQSFNKNDYSNNNSLERFATACNMVEQVKKLDKKTSAVDYSFQILDKVSQGDFTKWSIVYDLKNKQIHFKTESSPDRKMIRFNAFNFDCGLKSRIIDVNTGLKGDISEKMESYSSDYNRKIVTTALLQSRPRIPASDSEKQAVLAYPATVLCKK